MLTTGWTVPQLLKQMKMVAPYSAPKMLNRSFEFSLEESINSSQIKTSSYPANFVSWVSTLNPKPYTTTTKLGPLHQNRKKASCNFLLIMLPALFYEPAKNEKKGNQISKNWKWNDFLGFQILARSGGKQKEVKITRFLYLVFSK
jgi:hypothetical protein